MPSGKPSKLLRSFYIRDTLTVASELIGKYVVYNEHEKRMSARIVEVEAYIGEDDPACHAACGPTDRNRLMYGKPGVAYIYFIYGMYYCLNFVTEKKGFPAAVLLRAAEPVDGLDSMRKKGMNQSAHVLLNGPGKFCRGFGLTLKQNGMDLTGSTLYIEDRNEQKTEIRVSERIGIRNGRDRMWRFFDTRSKAVSKYGHRKEGMEK
jgi:DNA-3-methyladenine glycosylase